MLPLLERFGVTVVAVSKDPPDVVRAHRARDGLTLTMLSDPDLTLIRDFGLLHQGSLEFKTWLVGPVRFPVGVPVGFRSMAIPTTLLLDERHVVRHIDQADDYRVRGDAGRTRAALEAAFGPPPAA
jgi:peroxiredoxin